MSRLNVPVATVGASNGAALSFREVAGLVTLTPTGGSNNGVTLRVPYYLVPRALSGVKATMAKSVTTASPTTNANLSNPTGPIAGDADFYAWGLNDSKRPATTRQMFGRSASSRSQAPSWSLTVTGALMVFAVNTWNRWSNAATNEFDIYVDVDPAPATATTTSSSASTRALSRPASSTAGWRRSSSARARRALASSSSRPRRQTAARRFCRSLASSADRQSRACRRANPRLTYHAFGFDILSNFVDMVAGRAKYNAYPSSISQGMFATVPVGASGAVPVSINPAEWAQTPALGSMVVTLDNKAGKEEAALLPLELKP